MRIRDYIESHCLGESTVVNVTVFDAGTVAVNPATMYPEQGVSHEFLPLASHVVYVTGEEESDDVLFKYIV